ncbi:MAG: hypothetical protein O3B42_04380 [Actinomycetota bacterium]|nr:hypothetical protein [Actinomycetota bacterium]
MATLIDLTIDKQNRMSVGKLGLSEGHAVAEELPDGSGWVIRPAQLVTQAQIDIMSHEQNASAIERSLVDIAQGHVEPRTRR